MTVYLDHTVVCPRIVGRSEHIQALQQLIAQARGGQGQTVVIAGEAGIGKTRLVMEIASRASTLGFLLLQGHCFEPDRTLPYAPLLDLLRSLFSPQATPDVLREARAAPEILTLVPELQIQMADVSPPPPLDPEQDKRRLFHALCQFFIRLSLHSPLLMVLEDLHWSDDASLDFLLYLARRVGSQRILLLLTYRDDEIRPALAQFLAQADRERLVGEMTVRPLSQSDVNAMIQTTFELPYPVHAEFMDTVYPLTGGNPFFVEEVLKALLVKGEIFRTDGTWVRVDMNQLQTPRSVEGAVQRRSMQLSDDARTVLVLAAVIGERFDFELLRNTAHHAERKLLALMKELVAAQLVVEEGARQFAFRHALTRHAIYTQPLAMERTNLHRLIGETMERIYADSLDAHLGDLAYHFYQAGVWAKALGYSRRAGERAQRLYAPRAAIEHYTHALEAVAELSLPPDPRLLRARGQMFETVGDFGRARSDFEGELSAAKDLRDGATEWQSLIDVGFLWASRDYARSGEYLEQALTVARAMGDPSLMAHSLNRVGNWHLNSGRLRQALQNHEQALELFQGLKDQRGIAGTLDLLGIANFHGGDLVASAAHYEQAVALFRAMDDRQGLVNGLGMLMLCGGIYLSDTAAPTTALAGDLIRGAEEALRIAREIGWRSGEASTLLRLGEYLGPRGEYAQALKVAHEGLELATEAEHGQWMTVAHWSLGTLYLDLLALEQARAHLEQALRLAKEIRSLHFIDAATGRLASLYILQKEYAEAESLLERASEGASAPEILGQRLCLCARAELRLAQGDWNQALEIVDLLKSRDMDSRAHVIPRLAKLQGDALVLRKQFEQAERLFQSAVESAHAQGARPWLWRIHVSLGKLHRLQRRPNQAALEFSSARHVVDELAANIPDPGLRNSFVGRAVALIPRARPSSPRQVAKKEFGGLTEREREVVALIGQGKSNKEIADALVVSERTIGAHVGSILSKLGMRSRTLVAAWAIEKGLAKPHSVQDQAL